MEKENKTLPKKYGTDIDEQGTDRARQADILLRFLDSASAINAFRGRPFAEIFSSEAAKRGLIENLSEKDFVDLLNGLNGILRNKKKEDWGMDGEEVEVTSLAGINTYAPPLQEDKPELLGEILEAAKKMNRDGRDIGDIALMLSSSVVAVHAYGDANGRMGRLAYHLLSENLSGDPKKDIVELLSLDGRDRIDINPHNIQSRIEDIIHRKIAAGGEGTGQGGLLRLFRDPTTIGPGFQFRGEVPEEDRKLFSSLFKTDRKFFYFAANDFVKKDPNRDDYLIKSFDPPLISADAMARKMPAEKVAEFIRSYRDLKKEYVRILMDSFVNPDKEDYKIDVGGFEEHSVRLKDYFEDEIHGKI